MLYQKNGNYKIPVLGLGTAIMKNDEQLLTNVLNEALKQGYRHIDTATGYNNEHIIGKVLKEWLSSGKIKREELFITTKLPSINLYEDQVENALKTSLEKLQLDYVDLWLIHSPIAVKIVNGERVSQPTDFISVWKKMEEQVDAGRTRTIGLSNFNISQIKRIQEIARIPPANLQVEVNIYFQNRELVEFAQENNITVVAYGPLGNPRLTNRTSTSPIVLNDKLLQEISTKHKKSIAQVVFKFLVQKSLVPIPKSTSAERLKENINIFNFELDQDDIKKLESLDKGEAARLYKLNWSPEIKKHPEYPFK